MASDGDALSTMMGNYILMLFVLGDEKLGQVFLDVHGGLRLFRCIALVCRKVLEVEGFIAAKVA